MKNSLPQKQSLLFLKILALQGLDVSRHRLRSAVITTPQASPGGPLNSDSLQKHFSPLKIQSEELSFPKSLKCTVVLYTNFGRVFQCIIIVDFYAECFVEK